MRISDHFTGLIIVAILVIFGLFGTAYYVVPLFLDVIAQLIGGLGNL